MSLFSFAVEVVSEMHSSQFILLTESTLCLFMSRKFSFKFKSLPSAERENCLFFMFRVVSVNEEP